MSKTKITGIVIIALAIGKAALNYLQGQPVDYALTAQEVSAGFGLIFLRSAIADVEKAQQ